MQSQAVVEGWKGVMHVNGLGTPGRRAFTAAVLAGIAAWAMKYPQTAWGPDGKVRPLRALSPRNDAVNPGDHFLRAPLIAAFIAGCCI